jgi:hypothetical protein
MKTKVFILIGILIIAFAAVVAPVMAGTSGTTTITGNPAKTISITVNGPAISLNLDPTASPAVDSTHETLDVSSNTPSWTVKVKDALDDGKPSAGKMVDYLTTGPGPYGTLALGTAINVGSASVTPGFTGSTKTLSGADQTIELGDADFNAANTFSATPLTFTQPVVITDSVLGANHVYRIIVTFTASVP